jgi:diadenosine tetraphosphate (Ap4A) HIT family hydrolase
MGGVRRATVSARLCAALADPVVPHLNAMPDAARRTFLDDMARLGDAVLAATAALRINYAMFGNLEPALHAHVIPRFDAEEPSLATQHAVGIRLNYGTAVRS